MKAFFKKQLIGKHWIGDITGCNAEDMRNEKLLVNIFEKSLISNGATILKQASHIFDGEGGITGFFLLSESHASFHSYPEFKYIAVDIFTCGNCNPVAIANSIISDLKTAKVQSKVIDRGLLIQKLQIVSQKGK